MKRNYDLIRLILLDVENDVVEWSDDVMDEAGNDHVINYHVRLLVEHGELGYKRGKDGSYLVLMSGTWVPGLCHLTTEGHDLLDDIRDDSTFGEVKEKISKVGGKVNLHVFKSLAAEAAKRFFGL